MKEVTVYVLELFHKGEPFENLEVLKKMVGKELSVEFCNPTTRQRLDFCDKNISDCLKRGLKEEEIIKLLTV